MAGRRGGRDFPAWEEQQAVEAGGAASADLLRRTVHPSRPHHRAQRRRRRAQARPPDDPLLSGMEIINKQFILHRSTFWGGGGEDVCVRTWRNSGLQ